MAETRVTSALRQHPLADAIPAMLPDEWQEFLSDIAARGIQVPVEITPDYVILDGRHRWKAAKELGLAEVPVRFVNPEAPVEYMAKAATHRRHLTPGQRAAMAVALLPALEEEAKKNQATSSPGVYGGKPLSQRIDEPVLRRSDAKAAAAVGANRQYVSDAKRILEDAPDLFEQVKSADITIPQARKEMARRETETTREQAAQRGAAMPTPERTRLFVKDIRQIDAADIADDSIDVIITDPPYPAEYLPLYSDLSALAARVLKPGGLLVAMSGQSYLPEVYQRLSDHLSYWWTACYLAPGASTQLWQRKVLTQWKPLLVFCKGDYSGAWLYDVCKSDAPDKEGHDWGQSVSGMDSVLQRFAKPGMVVLDPFCGAGATGVAALKISCQFVGIDIEEKNINITKERLQ